MPEFVPGIDIDPDTRTYLVCGVHMVVGNLERNPYEPAHPRDRTKMPAGLVELIEEGNPGFWDREQGSSPESIHATLLCGENGWWVEVAVWPGDPEYTSGLSFSLPDEPWSLDESRTAEDLLQFWRQACIRRDAPPDWQANNDPGPFGGLNPGTWWWHDDEVTADG